MSSSFLQLLTPFPLQHPREGSHRVSQHRPVVCSLIKYLATPLGCFRCIVTLLGVIANGGFTDALCCTSEAPLWNYIGMRSRGLCRKAQVVIFTSSIVPRGSTTAALHYRVVYLKSELSHPTAHDHWANSGLAPLTATLPLPSLDCESTADLSVPLP